MQRSSPLQMVNYEAPAVQTEAAPRTTQNQKNKTFCERRVQDGVAWVDLSRRGFLDAWNISLLI